jgi:hypothetical protein
MFESTCRDGLALKASNNLWLSRHRTMKNLEGDTLLHQNMFCFVYGAHASLANQATNSIALRD